MDPTKIDIVTRPIGSIGGDSVDQVVGIRVGGQLVELPEDSAVKVEHEGGPNGFGGRVRVELLATQVRYVTEAEARGCPKCGARGTADFGGVIICPGCGNRIEPVKKR